MVLIKFLLRMQEKGSCRVGNAVPGVPAGAMRRHRARKTHRTAAFGGRNAVDGVPHGCLCF